MAIELRLVVRERQSTVGWVSFARFLVVGAAALAFGVFGTSMRTESAVVVGLFCGLVTFAVYLNIPALHERRTNWREREEVAWLGKDGLRHPGGFVRRAEIRAVEATTTELVVKTYGGEPFRLRGSTLALAEAKKLTRGFTPGVVPSRDEELEALVLRAANEPVPKGEGYRRAADLLTAEQALGVAEDPVAPPRVRVAALALLEHVEDDAVHARLRVVADETAEPEVADALAKLTFGRSGREPGP